VAYGPSGAGVWSSPMIDEQLGVLYVATGDNYSEPATNTSDAVIAIDLKSGKLLWSKQLTSDDVFNNSCLTPQRTNCQHPPGPDYDFGQSPILASLSGAKRALLVAQKEWDAAGLAGPSVLAGALVANNRANISYDKICEYTDIPRARLRTAISFLASLSLIYIEHVPSRSDPKRISSAYRVVGIDPSIIWGPEERPRI